MKTRNQIPNKVRMEITQRAAKLIAMDGIQNFIVAKTKAAQQLGYADCKDMPKNNEIEQALIEYQTLFQAETQPNALLKSRKTALNTMQMLENFKPRLVGTVLTGTASTNSEILIYIYCDSLEQVNFHLDEYGVLYVVTDKKIKINSKEIIEYPALQFNANQIPVSLVIFPVRDKNLRPLDPANDRPLERATIKNVECLLADNT